jgi:hypothetical protein
MVHKSTVDLGLRRRVSSSELTFLGGSGQEGSPGWLQHKEGQAGNLTEVFGNRRQRGTNGGGGARCGAGGGTERRNRVWDEVRWGAAVLGVPFIGRGGSGGEGRRPAAVDF